MEPSGVENGTRSQANASASQPVSPPPRHISVAELGNHSSRRNATNVGDTQHGRHSVGTPTPLKKTPNDFIFLKVIGEGSFSHVRYYFLCQCLSVLYCITLTVPLLDQVFHAREVTTNRELASKSRQHPVYVPPFCILVYFHFISILNELPEPQCTSMYLNEEARTRRLLSFAIHLVKVCEKKLIVRERKQAQVLREKEVYARLQHPLCIKLYCTFQDNDRLYILRSYDTPTHLSLALFCSPYK